MALGDRDDVERALHALETSRPFDGVAQGRLLELARCGQRHHFSSGEVLMTQGGPSDSIYVIVQGQVRVTKLVGSMQEHRADLEPGEVVGEMGVLTGEPRSATVAALGEVETLRVGSGDLLDVFRDDHFVLVGFIKIMHERLHGPSPG